MTSLDDFSRRIRERQQREAEAVAEVRERVPQPLVDDETHRAMPAMHCQVADCALHGRGQHRQIRAARVESPEASAESSSEQPVKTVRGRPFRKGESGNPGGRPKVADGFREFARAFMDSEGREHLAAMARSGGKDAFAALQLLAHYSYGRPVDRVALGQDSEAGPARIVVEYVTTAPINDDYQQEEQDDNNADY